MKFASLVTMTFLLLTESAFSADWPQWRGPGRDGISAETGLLQQWPETGPSIRWKATDIGTGYSAPVIRDGRVYLQTTRGDEEFALALDERSGDQIWSARIGKVGKNKGPQYPGTRSTPTLSGEVAYCLASDGELVCLNVADGEVKWQRHLRNDFAGECGNWAYSESVLIDGDTLVCTPGGSRATLLALDKNDGEVIWESPVPDGDIADYASIMAVEGGGPKQYVQFLRKGLVGVDASTGKFLWRYDRTVDRGANILTPIVAGNRVFSAGSRSGGGLVELAASGENVSANEVYFEQPLNASIGGAVKLGEHLYGTSRGVLFCADFETGKILWKEKAVGDASICYADGRLYVRGHSEGVVVLVEPSPDGYREKGRLEQPNRSETRAWPHPVVANGGLYLRDQNTLLCYNVSAG